jgi:ParB-like nuclease domain
VIGDAHYLGKSVQNFADSLRSKVKQFTRPTRGQEINIDVFQNPKKYLVRVPIEEIVADIKVTREGVDGYKQKIKSGEKIAPLIVVKHPKFDKYAVLDGHHRYYAYLELGKKEVDCALAGDFSSVIYNHD